MERPLSLRKKQARPRFATPFLAGAFLGVFKRRGDPDAQEQLSLRGLQCGEYDLA